eukprot:XP_001698557.1 predicted protein [Chlamydomonas reinhardtii]
MHTQATRDAQQLLEAAEVDRAQLKIERYACLYTSHVSNLAFFSPDKSWMGRMDVMAHEAEGEVWDAMDAGLDAAGMPPSGADMDVGV